MASGKTHALATKISFVLQTGAMIHYNVAPDLIVYYATGLVFGHLMTPDLDMEEVTHEEYRIGPWWTAFWMDYAKQYQHRGVSHAPVKGTWTRWKYINRRLLFLPLCTLAYATYTWPITTCSFVVFCFAGQASQDFVHLILDRFKYYE